jgi:hypothetical protein
MADRKFLDELEKEGLQQQLSSKKYVKFLMAKIRKELKSIETTGIRKVLKEVPAEARKAHRLEVTFFASNLCIV